MKNLTPIVNRKSNAPRNTATTKENIITITVNNMAWFFVGQLTCFNSAFVSFKYSPNCDIWFIRLTNLSIKKPRLRGLLTLLYFV